MAALTGKLGADFSEFTDAVQKAEGQVTGLGQGAQRAGASLTSMGSDVPPKMRAITDEAKAAESAFHDWEATLGSLNSLLGPLGIGVGLYQVVSLGKEILEDANILEKFHDKTGISVEGLQALRIASDEVGVSLESMTNAITMMQKRLGGDDAKAMAGLKDLNIDIAQFKALDGAQQMVRLSEAIKTIQDPLRLASDLSGIFGRQWAENLPVLWRGFEEVSTGAGMMSSETVGALDKMGDAARRMWLQMKANIGENFVSLMTLTLPIVRQVGSELDAMATSAAKALPGMKDLAPVGLPSDLATIDAQLRSIARTKEENYQVDLRLKKLREEINKLELEGSQITAGALGLSRQEQEQTQKGFESQLRGYDSIEKASAALRDFRIKATNDAVDYEIWKLWDEVAQEEKAFKGAEAQRSEYNAVVEELATEQAQKLRDAADSAAVGVEAIATAEFHAAAGAVAFHDSLNLIVTGMRDYKQFGQEGWFGYAPTGAAPAFINAAGVRPFSPTAPTAAGTYTPPPGGGLGGRGTSVQVGDVHVNGFSGDASGLADKIARQLMNEITRTAPVPLTR